MTLREALQRFLEDWRNDLGPGWRAMLHGIDPAFADVRGDLQYHPREPIYPARRASPLAGAPAGAHVFRAFDGIEPGKVRCILVGQDPYPRISRATGRSFEQGDLANWNGSAAATSLKTLIQMLAAARTGHQKYVQANGWREVIADINQGSLDLDTPRELFDRLQQEEGLLFLNAGLTITRYIAGGAPEQLFGHITLWAPIIGKVLSALAAKTTGQVVFLLLGLPAQKIADRVRTREIAEEVGNWGKRVEEVRLPHPASNQFLSSKNPFLEVNARLAKMGGPPINW